MNWLRKAFDEIGRQFRRLELTRTQIVTIAMLGASVALFLILIGIWGTATDWAPLSATPVTGDSLNTITSALDSRGIQHRVERGQVLVPVDSRSRALAMLAEGELAGADFLSGAFYYRDVLPVNNLLVSSEQQRFQRQIARANELSRALGFWAGIRQAKVEVAPEVHTTRLVDPVPAKASVMVFKADPNKPLTQNTVNAIASFVSGAIEHLPVENVVVIDADLGRRLRVKNPDRDDLAADERFAQEQQRAEEYAQRIRDIFGTMLQVYEDKIKVNVSVALNLDRRHTESKIYDPERPGALTLDRSESEIRTSTPPSGDIMTPPMTRGSIEAGAGGGANTETTTTSRTASTDHSYVRETVMHVAGQATDVSAAVVLPYDGVAKLALNRMSKDEFDSPQERETAVASMLSEFERYIRQHLLVSDPSQPGKEPRVTVVAWPALEAPALAVIMPSAGQQAKAYLLSHLREVALALLTLGAFVVLWRALKKGQDVPVYDTGADDDDALPSLEELLPKTPLDVTGLRLQKMNEAIADAVGINPGGSASLLKRWITRES